MWTHHFFVLAEQSPFESLGNQFRGNRARFDTDDLITGLILLGAFAIGVLILSWLLSRQERRRTYNSPQALFRELCRAHGLDRASRRLLAQLARWQRLEHPALLFVEPNRFEPANLSPYLSTQRRAFESLRNRLFAQPAPAAASRQDEQRTNSPEVAAQPSQEEAQAVGDEMI